MRRAACLIAALALAACTDERWWRCDQTTPKIYPATGNGAAVSGALTPGAQDQRITVSADRRSLVYTFTRDGAHMTARYALTEASRPRALYFVVIGRPPPAIACADLAGRGPVIDSVEVRRGGAVISDARSFFASGRCGESLTAKASEAFNGAPDGSGLALGGADLGWAVGTRIALVSGDEVTVTVLDASGEPFEVYATGQQTSYDVKLGTLTGTGTLTVP
jgi:hypothetical protein